MKALRNPPLNGIEEVAYSPFGEAIFPLLETISGSNSSTFPTPRCSLDLVTIHKLKMEWLSFSDTKLGLKFQDFFNHKLACEISG